VAGPCLAAEDAVVDEPGLADQGGHGEHHGGLAARSFGQLDGEAELEVVDARQPLGGEQARPASARVSRSPEAAGPTASRSGALARTLTGRRATRAA